MSTSWSTRKDVVRRWRPPIPPEQPSTRNRIVARLLLVERGHAIPILRRRCAAIFSDALGIERVQSVAGFPALQPGELSFRVVPAAAAIGGQHLVPRTQLLVLLWRGVANKTERLEDGDRRVLAFHADAVDLAKQHVARTLASRLAHQDAHAVVLGAALEARR